jgi:hypothetical protein
MNKLSLAVITGLTFFSVNSLQASELSYLYKDQRIMSMGGANVASGGYSTSLFSNPAGIAKVDNEHGTVVEVLGIQAGVSGDSADLVNDLMDAMDVEDTGSNETAIAIDDVYAEYSEQKIHLDVSNYSSITNNHGKFAWSLGVLTAVDANLTPYYVDSGDNVLEIHSRAYGGVTTAMSYTFDTSDVGFLSVGLGGKVITQQSYEDTLTATELVDDNETLADDVEDTVEDGGTAFSGDFGLIYQFNTALKPSFGISVLNIGDLDFNDAYGSQPMTVNLGLSIEPDMFFAKKTIIAFDYVDILYANKTRNYDLVTGDGSYTEVDDTSLEKRLRFGMSALVYENSWSTLELAGGIYQGAYTAGLTFTALLFKVGVNTYQEQYGTEDNELLDRRYNLSVSLGW